MYFDTCGKLVWQVSHRYTHIYNLQNNFQLKRQTAEFNKKNKKKNPHTFQKRDLKFANIRQIIVCFV